MSDALTDIARDQERAECVEAHLEAIQEFLRNPSLEQRSAVYERAKAADAVRRGYFSGRTDLFSETEKLLEGLLEQDRNVWAKFLFRLEGRYFQMLKELSPFKGKVVLQVDYRQRFVQFGGDVERCKWNLEAFSYEQIGVRNELKTYDSDKYLLVLDGADAASADVFWCGCGIYGQNKPRKAVR